MIASIFITIIVVPAVLLLLLNVAATEAYTGRVPSGANAMGLALPFFTSVIGSVALILAAWVGVARGELDWIGGRTEVVVTVATAVSVGVGLAATGVLIAWMEKMGSWVPPLGLLCGGFGPLCLGGLLLVSTWAPREVLVGSMAPKVAGGGLVLVAACGFAMGLAGAWKYAQRSSENSRRVMERRDADEKKWARKRNRTAIEALREDYAEMSNEAPLWVFVAALPDQQEPECRTFIIDRALKVPEFDRQLAGTLADTHPRYRHGCLDLIRFAPASAVKAEWAGPLTEAVRVTVGQISQKPSWFEPDGFSNPDPVEHIRAMVEASRRLGDPQQAMASLHELKNAVAHLPQGDVRDAALVALNEIVAPREGARVGGLR